MTKKALHILSSISISSLCLSIVFLFNFLHLLLSYIFFNVSCYLVHFFLFAFVLFSIFRFICCSNFFFSRSSSVCLSIRASMLKIISIFFFWLLYFWFNNSQSNLTDDTLCVCLRARSFAWLSSFHSYRPFVGFCFYFVSHFHSLSSSMCHTHARARVSVS